MKKHNFVDKHPIGASLIIGILMLLLIQVIGAIPASVYTVVTTKESPLLNLLCMIAATAIVMLIYKKRFAPEYKGVVRKEGLAKGLFMGLPLLAYWIISSIPSFFDHTFVIKPLTMEIISSAVVAGITEEAAFRHGMITTMLRNRNQKENLVRCILISSVAFGFLHLFNMAIGADPIRTILQTIGATGLGVLFGAIFISTGNILPGMILHAVHDIFAIATSTDVSSTGVISGSVGISQLIDLLCCVALGVYAILRYLPDDRKEETVALWNKIWSKNQ